MTFVVAWVSGKRQVTYRDQSGSEVTKKDGSRSWRNNNPGNIARGSFSDAHGAIGDDGRFGIFPDEETGLAAIVALFTGSSYKSLSIRDAFYRYAPPGDNNDTEAYIAAVTAAVGVPASTIVSTLSASELAKLAGAIKVHEGWTVGVQTGTASLTASQIIGASTAQRFTALSQPVQVTAIDQDFQVQLQTQIDRDLAAWNASQQKQSMRYRAAKEVATTLQADFHLEQKHLLAVGDSWFDYPIQGNNPLSGPSDIKVQLQSICSPSPIIYSTAHRGDASTDEMSLPKQERILQLLADKSNWPNGKPDAIIVSAGGNDVAGNNFCIFLDYNDGKAAGLNPDRYGGVLAIVRSSYLALFALRDRHAPGVPIYAHCYDFPTPNGVGAPCGYGPWLKPSLDFCNWPANQGKAIVHEALEKFKAMLDALAADPKNKFHVVQTQGTLNDAHWANELHPDPMGFRLIAQKFAAALGMSQLSAAVPLDLLMPSAVSTEVRAVPDAKPRKRKTDAAAG